VSQLREFLFPSAEKRLDLPIRGIIMINQSNELGNLKTQGQEFLVLRVDRIMRARRGGAPVTRSLVFAKLVQHVRVVSVQGVSGDFCQLT